jgi:hypothetical protein
VTSSNRTAPLLSPSGAVFSWHKGQYHCPCRDEFELVCQHRHPQPDDPAVEHSLPARDWLTISVTMPCRLPPKPQGKP